LSSVALAGEEAADVADPKIIAQHEQDIAHELKQLGVTQRPHCTMMISILHRRNQSYGAFCNLKTVPPRTIIVCNDMMIGEFTMKLYGFAESRDWLIEFTKSNCPGAG